MRRLTTAFSLTLFLMACGTPDAPQAASGPGGVDMAPPAPSGQGVIFASGEISPKGTIVRQFHRDGSSIESARFMNGIYELKIPGAEGGGLTITPISDSETVVCRRLASYVPRIIVGCASGGIGLDTGFFFTYVR